MLLLILVGFGAARVGLLSEQGRKSIANLVVDLIYPCYILQGFIKNIGMFSGREMLRAFLVAVLYAATMLLVSWFIFPNVPQYRRCTLQYATAVSNSAFLGLPLVENLFGSPGLLYASIFIIPLRINTFGIAIHYFIPQNSLSPGARIKSVLTQPSILATLLGVVLVLTNWLPPDWCTATLSSIGACSTPLSMMVLGAVISANLKKMRPHLLTFQYTFLRLVAIPAVVFLLLRAIGTPPLLLATAVLMAAMPAATTGALLADKYERDVAYAGELILVSTLCAILTLPLWCYLCIL